jgi:hypothetical protein
MGQMAKIYDWMGTALPEHVRQLMRRTLEAQIQHRYGYHRYRLEDFGLDRKIVKKLFRDYVARFCIPSEETAQSRNDS